jgi:hypothetical protein
MTPNAAGAAGARSERRLSKIRTIAAMINITLSFI